MGVVASFVLIVALLGPENHGSHFEKHKTAFERGGGDDDAYMDDEISDVDIEVKIGVSPDKGIDSKGSDKD